MVSSKNFLAAFAIVAFTGLAAPQIASADSVTFTKSQASTGEKTFGQSCATCHGENLEGGAGPALAGDNFKTLSTKVKATVGDVFTYMTTNMPMNAPASLSHDQYTTIMAFILSKNGYKP
ncbi:MAG: c-type cytochrome, partial [Vulcanimicrobiaceae bacterium]